MPEAQAPSKPPSRKPRLFWLLAPYAAVAVLAAVGSVGWFIARIDLARNMDHAVQTLRAQGVDVSWTRRRVGGFPFRLNLILEGPRIADRSGWTLTAPRIEGEAFVYDLGHWIVAAPQGVIVTRPGRGALDVTGQAIRASVTGLGSPAPRYSFQGLKLTFSPEPGAAPPSLGAADLLEAHLQPGPDDQAALLIRLDGGRPPLSAAANGTDQNLALVWDSRLSHMSALSGSDWPTAVRRWTAKGGVINLVHAQLTLGAIQLAARPATLTVGDDGRLQGTVPLSLSQSRAAKTLFGSAPLTLTFQGGATRLGPLPLGPAFRVF
jgi:hypothetical protein